MHTNLKTVLISACILAEARVQRPMHSHKQPHLHTINTALSLHLNLTKENKINNEK